MINQLSVLGSGIFALHSQSMGAGLVEPDLIPCETPYISDYTIQDSYVDDSTFVNVVTASDYWTGIFDTGTERTGYKDFTDCNLSDLAWNMLWIFIWHGKSDITDSDNAVIDFCLSSANTNYSTSEDYVVISTNYDRLGAGTPRAINLFVGLNTIHLTPTYSVQLADDIHFDDDVEYTKYPTLSRESATIIRCVIYNESGRTTEFGFGSQDLTIDSGVGELKFLKIAIRGLETPTTVYIRNKDVVLTSGAGA